MTTKASVFRTHRMPPPFDPCPHAITPEEREHIQGRLSAGQLPRVPVIRKLLRLCDERLDIIRHLESKRAG